MLDEFYNKQSDKQQRLIVMEKEIAKINILCLYGRQTGELIQWVWMLCTCMPVFVFVCVCAHRERERERERPVISKGETIKHVSSISAWAIHGRHSCTLLTASILQDRIEHYLWENGKKFLHKSFVNITGMEGNKHFSSHSHSVVGRHCYLANTKTCKKTKKVKKLNFSSNIYSMPKFRQLLQHKMWKSSPQGVAQ